MYTSRCKGDNLTTWIIQTSLCYNFAANEDTIGITKKLSKERKKKLILGLARHPNDWLK